MTMKKILITITEQNLEKLKKLTEQDERDTGYKPNMSKKIGELIHREYLRYQEIFETIQGIQHFQIVENK